jgi:ParB/RepB/Spo0J family partition protein
MKIREIPVASIKIPPSYSFLEDEGAKDRLSKEELMKSIELNGLLQPICVDENNVLVYGRNRLEAFKGLGREFIPSTTVNCEASDHVIIQLTENLLRNKPTMVDFGRFFVVLEKRYGLSKEKISEKTGRSLGFIISCLNIYNSFSKKDHKKIKMVSPTALRKLANGVRSGYLKSSQAKEIAENVKEGLLKINDVDNVIMKLKKENSMDVAVTKTRNIIHVSITIDIDKKDLANKFGTTAKMAAFVKQMFYSETGIDDPTA